MSIKTASYFQIVACLWIFDGVFLWVNFGRDNLFTIIICGVLLFAIPTIAYAAYKLYIPYKKAHPINIKWPKDITYPYRIEVPFQCTVILNENNLWYNSKDTFFKKKASIAYSSINGVSAYVQVNAPSGAIMSEDSVAVKYSDPAKEPRNTNSTIYIFASWMNKYDYSVLIKTLREKCPAGTFDENLLKDFEAEEQSMKRSNSSN